MSTVDQAWSERVIRLRNSKKETARARAKAHGLSESVLGQIANKKKSEGGSHHTIPLPSAGIDHAMATLTIDTRATERFSERCMTLFAP